MPGSRSTTTLERQAPGTTPVSDLSIGLDIGGTFTDAVLYTSDGSFRAKSPTTPSDLGDGVVAACGLLAEQVGLELGELLGRLGRMTLGTTAVTNVLTSRVGRRVGVITTAGFEDELQMSKGRRLNEDGWVVGAPELVARRDVRGVRERVDRTGTVLVPLEEQDVLRAAEELVASGVEAIAISFLWSHLEPAHERLAERVVRERFDGLPVMSGALLNPVARGFERTTYAVLNAYTSGAFTGIDGLESRLAELGLEVPLLVVNCAGGAMTLGAAKEQPISLVHSGPAAGVSASAVCAIEHGLPDAVACDMGGTSFDVALVSGGTVSRSVRGEIFGTMTSLAHVDVESIGAGGGSIGWIDRRGVLRVGPQSAGAVPGPACYGNGGTEPTITDALVVLGYIDPAAFLGGRMTLDGDAARAACERLAEPLGLTVDEVAWGIRSLALNNMAKATRMAIASRGLDPRTHAIVSYGGCGSLFSGDIARELRISSVAVPETASVFSAFGAVTAATRRERTLGVGQTLPVDEAELAGRVAELVESVQRALESDGVPRDAQVLELEADVRFRQQVAELTIPLRSTAVDAQALAQLVDDFREEYVRRYGRGALLMGAPMELVTVRAIGSSRPPIATASAEVVAGGTEAEPTGSRAVRLERLGDPVQVPTFDLESLQAGDTVIGPALLDGSDTTVWVPPGSTGRVAADRSFLMTIGGPA